MPPISADPEALFPALPEFLVLARSHTLVPVCRRLNADLETPVSAFLRLAADAPECFMLESVGGGEKLGRYTLLGIEPYQKIVARGKMLSLTRGRKKTVQQGDVFAFLKEALAGHTPARIPG